ncbi:hypothetical protein C6W10_26390 [Plantactinospora sp. BB1]|nr:hypothetical protein C6W10_26390 [Plantactinospora sp. BB1]
MTSPNELPISERPMPFRLRPHSPRRPLWHCSGCPGQPWPCGVARLLLRAEFSNAPVGLALYMSAQLMEALTDLHRLSPSPAPEPKILFQRFVAWTAREPLH